MKLLFTLLLCVCYMAENHAQDKRGLLDYFVEMDLPIVVYVVPETNGELPYEITLSSFYHNCTNCMKYQEILVDMEDNKEWGRIDRTKKVYPCFFYEYQDVSFVVYESVEESGFDASKVKIGIVNKNNLINSEQIIYSYDEFGTQEIISKIYGPEIYVFEYNTLWPDDEKSANYATRINIRHYVVDFEKAKFELIKDESVYSKTEMYLFSKYKEVPDSIKAQDPFYKY